MVIRPRCQECGEPSQKQLTPIGSEAPEFYCAGCLVLHFNTGPQPMAVKDRIDLAAKRHVTGTR